MPLPEPSSFNPAPLSFLLNWTGRCVDEAMEAAAGTESLSVVQAKFMRHMMNKPEGVTLAELAQLAGCTRANVTQMLDRLEGAKLTERRANPDDARSTRAFVTPEGAKAFRNVERGVKAFEQRLVSALGRADAERMWNILRTVKQAL